MTDAASLPTVPTTPTTISIVHDPTDPVAVQPPVGWAVDQLRQALAAHDITATTREQVAAAPGDQFCIVVAAGDSPVAREALAGAGVTLPAAPEAVALVPGTAAGRRVLLATGGDVRGLVYAVTELADRAACAANPRDALDALRVERPSVEQPANAIRSVMRLFTCDVMDKPWFYDRDFWAEYLSYLVAQRFNRFALALGIGYDFPRNVVDAYFYFPYPFLVRVPGFDVRVSGLADGERGRNLDTLRFVGEEAARRGLHFQLGLWTHAYEWIDSPRANHVIEGLSEEQHAAYCRAAVRTLLQACPAVNGVTFRIHGESGVAEGSYDFWREVFAGVKEAAAGGRQLELDLHAKGIDQRIIDTALETGLPITVSPKYWAEHMGLPYHQAWIRPPEQSRREGNWEQRFMALSAGSRRFTRYGYADLLTEDRRYGVLWRIWPGTQRVLLWGDPAFARGYGQTSHFCASRGTEVFEPLSFTGRRGSGVERTPPGRNTYADATLRPGRGTGAESTAEWQKYRYTYRLWGRLLYNPQTDPAVWRRYLRHELGAAPGAAEAAEAALANASRILPLVTTAYLPSAANNRYWPELYTNMPIVPVEGDQTRPQPYSDTPSPKRFGTASPLDPELFTTVEECVDELVSGQRSGKYTPLSVAAWLGGLAAAATHHLDTARSQAADPEAPPFRRLTVDVAIQAALGRFFADKLRAGVEYAVYRRTGSDAYLGHAVERYQRAREAWREAAAQAQGVYLDDLVFGPEPFLRGHWSDRLAAIDQDIQDMRAEWERVRAAGGSDGHNASSTGEDSISAPDEHDITAWRDGYAYVHTPPPAFRRGSQVAVALGVDAKAGGESADPPVVRLRYRHVDQAEGYQETEMRAEGGWYRAIIPGDYTDSVYPLQYYFRLAGAQGRAWLYPGFDAELANQPYFVVRQQLAKPA